MDDVDKAIAVAVLSTATEPPNLHANAHALRDVRRSSIDESYLEFLDQQIVLGARGPAWTDRLRRRRNGLAPFCGMRLLDCSIRVGTAAFSIYIDPDKRKIVYWEEYEEYN